MFFSLSSDDEVDEDETNEKKESQKGEEEGEEDEEEEMERKLAELKSEEVAELKRFVTHSLFSQLHLSQLKIVHLVFLVKHREVIDQPFFQLVEEMKTQCQPVLHHQKEEEAPEGSTEAEGEGGAKDGPSRRLHRRFGRLIHVFPQHHR